MHRHCRRSPACVLAAGSLLIAACSGNPADGAPAPSDGGTVAAAAPTPLLVPSGTAAGCVGDAAEGFLSDGDLVGDDYWLADWNYLQYARWVFHDTVDEGSFVLDLEMSAAYSDERLPGSPAEFWLTYGAAYESDLGPAADAPLWVELPNSTPPGQPADYAVAGTVTLNTGALPHSADGIWVRIDRPNYDYQIAVNQMSVTIRDPACAGSEEGSETTLPPSTSSTTTSSPTTTTTTEPGTALDALPPMVVSLGDSYISGEAGRWAGNVDWLYEYLLVDTGADAYNDAPGGQSEQMAGCHRSESAAVGIGRAEDGTVVVSRNLACSGARTYTNGGKPGVDRCTSATGATEWNRYQYQTLQIPGPVQRGTFPVPYDCNGVTGQVESLRQLLEQVDGQYHIEMVVVSIGGNNFDFSGIVEQCVKDFLAGRDWDMHCAAHVFGQCVLWWPVSEDYCSDDAIADNVTTTDNLTLRQLEITASLRDIRTVMAGAGYTDDDWTMLVNTYPSPIPDSDEFRYIETGWSRQTTGGCGFWDEDADWANSVALPNITATIRSAVASLGAPNVEVLDLKDAFLDRRLCEDDVYHAGTLLGALSWTTPNAVNLSEWVQEIRGVLSEGGAIDVPPFDKNESFHPNYWGQLAIRSCIRQAYNNGDPIGGRCVRAGNGLTNLGEPKMDVVP
ncbi:MAG: hypothetical protein KKE89_07345 [Actinobacteria bacterium]|nr:hypothetical protein [Actinomycetota bacterium]